MKKILLIFSVFCFLNFSNTVSAQNDNGVALQACRECDLAKCASDLNIYRYACLTMGSSMCQLYQQASSLNAGCQAKALKNYGGTIQTNNSNADAMMVQHLYEQQRQQQQQMMNYIEQDRELQREHNTTMQRLKEEQYQWKREQCNKAIELGTSRAVCY